MRESGNPRVHVRLALVALAVASLLGLAMPVSAGGAPTPVPGALPTQTPPGLTPTPLATTAAEATATAAAPQALAVEFVSVTSPVTRGNDATVVVRTAPGAQCTITVTYASGPSTAAGLVEMTAGSDGLASWTWLVGGNTTPGSWPITVTSREGGREGTATTSFTVEAASTSGLQAPTRAETGGAASLAWVTRGLARIGNWLASVF